MKIFWEDIYFSHDTMACHDNSKLSQSNSRQTGQRTDSSAGHPGVGDTGKNQ